MYNYSLYKDTKGRIFIDNLLTRATYYVLDPEIYSASTSYYSHRSETSAPLLFANITSTVPVTASGSASYAVNLYQGSTNSIINSLKVTPLETTVVKDLVVPNDIYIGSSKAWKIKVDIARRSFIFQRKNTTTGIYQTEFEIQHENVN